MNSAMLAPAVAPSQRCLTSGPSNWLSRAQPVTGRPQRRALLRCRAQQQEVSTAQPAATQSVDQVPPGCSRYTVKLRKPLGIVLEEDRDTGRIVVAELVPEGAAARTGEVSVGDELIATSGRAYTSEASYQGNIVRQGEVYVRVNVRNESFDTVMAAITSHPSNMAVTLEFQRCE